MTSREIVNTNSSGVGFSPCKVASLAPHCLQNFALILCSSSLSGQVTGIHTEPDTSHAALFTVNIVGIAPSPKTIGNFLIFSINATLLPWNLPKTKRKRDRIASAASFVYVWMCEPLSMSALDWGFKPPPSLLLPFLDTFRRVENWSVARNTINLAQLDAWFMRKTKLWRSWTWFKRLSP